MLFSFQGTLSRNQVDNLSQSCMQTTRKLFCSEDGANIGAHNGQMPFVLQYIVYRFTIVCQSLLITDQSEVKIGFHHTIIRISYLIRLHCELYLQ